MATKQQAKAPSLCPICGWPILAADGQCHRVELHWTPESLAAEDAERKARRATRIESGPISEATWELEVFGEVGVFGEDS